MTTGCEGDMVYIRVDSVITDVRVCIGMDNLEDLPGLILRHKV